MCTDSIATRRGGKGTLRTLADEPTRREHGRGRAADARGGVPQDGRVPSSRPLGYVTRGTTNPNRLRRIDRWMTGAAAARRALVGADDPLVVDLGYGASPVTTVELASRLRRVRGDVEVVGIEIDRDRVRAAARFVTDQVWFGYGGFELRALAGRRPVLVRAANVLRQYDVGEVDGAWATLTGRLAVGGLVVDATCDEIGRRAAWVCLDGCGPRSLTISLRLAGLSRPSVVAERLPKALIHRNVAGDPVHGWLTALDMAWERAAALSSFGVRQRFIGACRELVADGWPVLDGPRRWRLGEISVAWNAVDAHQPP